MLSSQVKKTTASAVAQVTFSSVMGGNKEW